LQKSELGDGPCCEGKSEQPFKKSKIEEENMPPVCYTLFYENSQFL